MRGDMYFCRGCGRNWEVGDTDPAFCESCYGRDIVNLSLRKREEKRKAEFGAAARERKEQRERRDRAARRAEVKSREKSLVYYRGKN